MQSFWAKMENKVPAFWKGKQTQQQPESQNPAIGEDADAPIEASNVNKTRRTTMLVAILFGLGMLGLLLMIKKASPKMASALMIESEQARIDTTIAQLSRSSLEMSEGMCRLIRNFNQADNILQVRVGQLVKNPFRTEKFHEDFDRHSGTGEFDWATESDLGRLRQNAAGMQLLSIMQSGPRKCCMIDDKILYEGDSIRGFKVIYIGDNLAKLKSNEVEIILSLIND